MCDPYSGLQIYVKRYDVHNNVAYIMTQIAFLRQKWDFKVILMSSNIRALVLFYFIEFVAKKGKMLDKPRILCLFPNSFNKFNKTWALMEILYVIT